jgi:N-acetylneuraminic acid mutarotase
MNLILIGRGAQSFRIQLPAFRKMRALIGLSVALWAQSFVCTAANAQANEWTWVEGSGAAGGAGVYGTLGTAAAGNIPGARSSAVTWTDSSGNLWLFGGAGVDANGTDGVLNDLWEFNPTANQWTWIGGSSTVPAANSGQPGVYGTLGTPGATNIPGARQGAVSWIDSKGNLWLFGGNGYDSGGTLGDLNDLWEFAPGTKKWTWIGGSSVLENLESQFGEPGVYGTLGTPAAANIPGGRTGAVSWTDSQGNFWLFGGDGFASFGNSNLLNDLWEFNPTANQWTWVGGSDTFTDFGAAGFHGVYGSKGVPAAANVPGGRANAVSWSDSKGNFWMFGGHGFDSVDGLGILNDLWEFNLSTGEWTWKGGGNSLGSYDGVNFQSGVYQTWMTPSNGNFPGGRQLATSWTDKSGNLWLFGGDGYDSAGTLGDLNDLWEFSPATNQWSWMGGSSTLGNSSGLTGVYGTLQTPAFENTPGGRVSAISWTDGGGNFWLFGGNGYGSVNTAGFLNDLWKYQPYVGTMALAATPSFSQSAGTYTSIQTVTISDATPGSTIYYFIDGGSLPVQYTGPLTVSSPGTIEAIAVAAGFAESAVATAAYNVNPPIVATPMLSLPAGTYATAQTVSIADTTPGATIYYAINGTPTTSSNVYSGAITISSSETIEAMAVLAGYVNSSVATADYVLWPASDLNQWAWMGGSNTGTENEVVGTLGIAVAGNIPSPRDQASSWTDKSGNLWLFGGWEAAGSALFDLSGGNDLWKLNPATNEWAWIGGNTTASCAPNDIGLVSCTLSQPGVYGTLGTAAAGNIPGGRLGASSWIDTSGNLWLFGGLGLDAKAADGTLNDLWEFNPTTNEWTWISGSSTIGDNCFTNASGQPDCSGPGVYGTLGTPAAGNTPAGRQNATTWTDSSGNFWLFGGSGFDIPSQSEYLFSDLWQFSPSTHQWAWMGGSNTTAGDDCFSNVDTEILTYSICGQAGVYGALGTASAGSIPGGRTGATGWVDSSGNFWLLGGWGWDAKGNLGYQGFPDDLWEFNPSTQKWIWMGGNNTTPLGCIYPGSSCSSPAVTGTVGTPAAGNFPGPIFEPASWTDKSGQFWLYGGGGNQLWEFNPSANEWALMAGSTSTSTGTATYGTLGVPAAGNNPGGRTSPSAWTDSSGNFWLFGGETSTFVLNNDLWEFKSSAPAPVPGFALLDLNTAAFPVQPGTSGTTTINTEVADGFTGAISLSATGLPSDITATFSPGSVSGFGISQVAVSVAPGVAAGNYTFTVAGTSAGVTETTTISFAVVNTPPPTFTLGASPSSITVASAGQGTVTLTVTPQNGFSAPILLACSGLPAGATCSFSPTTITPTGAAATSVLTISTAAQSSFLRQNSRPLLPLAWAAGLLLVGIRRRNFSRSLMLIFVTIGIGLISSCGGGGVGGGGGSTGGGGGSTSGVSSTVTVTATAGSLQQTTSLTLTTE